MYRNKLLAIAACASALTGGCNESPPLESTSATPGKVQTAPDGSYVTVSGTVVESGPASFELDYGPGFITVEMDDFGWDADGAALIEDDEVIVYGRIDDDFYQQRTVEAGSVYVESLGTQFFASSLDEEQYTVLAPVYEFDDPELDLTGTVASVGEGQFVLETGAVRVEVDTGLLPYDPLDDEGYQKINAGDRVRVQGNLEPSFFDDQDLVANMVVSLQSGNEPS